MCGIVGFWSERCSESQSKERLDRMLGVLRHRGPDDCGLWVENGVSFGHARLSIHDLSPLGHQPMVSQCGRWRIVFNGEIYNYRVLKSQLAQEYSIHFKSESDTEVLVNAIAMWGIERTLKASVGMFAFACWDRREKKLYLARDRFGEKPLYYGALGEEFVFASELKSIKAVYKAHLNIDRDVLATYLRTGYVPTPYSIYANIFKLEPGSYLEVRESQYTKPVIYWSATHAALEGYRNPVKMSFQEASNEVERLLKEAIADQMMADVPVGAFLSGGVDSSLTVALMQSLAQCPIKTFSIGFHEKSFDEAHFAKAVAQHLRTDHTELYVTGADALAVVPKLVDIYDEPFADSSQVPTFLVSQLARQHVTVSLSGDGGDELFGGYTRYIVLEKLRRQLIDNPMMKFAFNALPDKLLKCANILPHRKFEHLGDKLIKAKRLIQDQRDFPNFYLSSCSKIQQPNDCVLGGKEHLRLEKNSYIDSYNQLDPTSWMMMMDVGTYLLDDILVKVDRAAMAVSLETRIPFLDHRLYEFAWRCPLNYKIHKKNGKKILKNLLYRYVPENLIERPKMGFGIPIGEWLRGPLREWASALLDVDKLQREGVFKVDFVTKKWKNHLQNVGDNSGFLWNILMYQLWYSSLK